MSAASRFSLFSPIALNNDLNPRRLLTSGFPFFSLRFHRYCFSASASVTATTIDTDASSNIVSPHHPWPEWVTFLDRLKAKGYFDAQNFNITDDKASASASVQTSDSLNANVYTDITLVKHACLSFGRDRYDIFKSLPVKDIRAVVEHGCPNLLRKAVTSAKRLRAHVRLDEGDVCSACNLRGSCDRAYNLLKESDGDARTIDIVRVLLFYALDPLVITGGNKPPVRELIDASARKLISQLIILNETSIDPSLPMPSSKSPQKNEKTAKVVDNVPSNNVEMKRGDWMCPKCNFMNFARNKQCLNCNEDGPRKAAVEIEMKKGDWTCSICNFINFSRNVRCRDCKAEGPKRIAVDEVEMKPGDWNCPKCGFMNFASNKRCLRCPEKRPLVQGEWECPSCDFVNYRRNKTCLKCKSEHPRKATTDYEEQLWKSPH